MNTKEIKTSAEKITIGQLIAGKSYDCVEYRMTLNENDNKGIFAGTFAVKNGEIVSLDGDSYHKKEVVLVAYEEWSSENVRRG